MSVLATRPPQLEVRSVRDKVLLAAVLASCAVLYGVYAMTRHAQYLTAGYDLGIFDQAVRAYSRFQAPVVPLKGEGFNLLGDHFHPILAVLAPLYWVWDDPRVLLLAQVALVTLSVWPVWRFTRRRLGPTASALVALAYAFSWPLQGMVDFDVHEIAFAVPLIAFAVDALDRRADRVLVVACGLLLLVREDMGAFLVAVALVLLLRRRWVFAAGVAAAGVVGLVVATSVVIPAFAPGGAFVYWTYDALGPGPGAALAHVVREPLDTVRLLVSPGVKWHTLVWLFGPTAFLALGSPYVLLTLPFLAQRLLNSRELLWTTEFHYSAVLAPVIVMAAVDTLGRLLARVTSASTRRRLTQAWVAVSFAVVVLGTLVLPQQFPLQRLFSGEAFRTSTRQAALDAALPLVPDGVCVEVDDRAAPHLTSRDHVLVAGHGRTDATWLVLDLSQQLTTKDGAVPRDYLQQALARGFTMVREVPPIVVLHRPGRVAPQCAD